MGFEIGAAIGIGKFPVLKKKMDVRVKVYRQHRRLDEDNLKGGVKVLIDAMRDVGLLYRDSPDWMKLEVEQELDHANPRTVVVIEPSSKSS